MIDRDTGADHRRGLICMISIRPFPFFCVDILYSNFDMNLIPPSRKHTQIPPPPLHITYNDYEYIDFYWPSPNTF